MIPLCMCQMRPCMACWRGVTSTCLMIHHLRRSIDEQEMRVAMKALGFNVKKEDIKGMIAKIDTVSSAMLLLRMCANHITCCPAVQGWDTQCMMPCCQPDALLARANPVAWEQDVHGTGSGRTKRAHRCQSHFDLVMHGMELKRKSSSYHGTQVPFQPTHIAWMQQLPLACSPPAL